jgi:homoserine dehydrogenase
LTNRQNPISPIAMNASPNEIEEFTATVEAFIAERGWTPTRFGRDLAGDPLFVFDLREGREPRLETRQRIYDAMQNEAAGGPSGESGVKMPVFRIGVAGLGTVGAALVRMLVIDAPAIARRLGRPVEVTMVCGRSRNKDRGVDLSRFSWVDDPVALAREGEIDLFVELMGGQDGPAYAAIKAALERGIPVVTANKSLLARHGVELAGVAEKTAAQLGFEAAVAGGIPVIKTLREGLGSAEIERVYGIMNGTANYILTRMGEEGISFAECLADAQALGFAEADPSFDVEGFDTAHKLAILTTLCFQTDLAPAEIFVEGITTISLVDVQVASDLGFKIKLLGLSQRSADGIEQRVHPTLVPKGSAIAGVDGVLNAVALKTNHVSELMMAGPGAGGDATAASVLSDIMDIVRGHRVLPLGVPVTQLTPYQRAPMRAHEGGYYVRINARDVAGALGAIAVRMGEAGISIDSVIQRPDLVVPATGTNQGPDTSTRTIVIITQQTTELAVREAMGRIAGDGFTVDEPQLIRIENL